MKKRTNLVLATAMLLAAGGMALASCGGSTSSDTSSSTPSSSSSSGDDEKVYKVGVIQYIQHVALDAATKGFEDTLTAKFEAAGKNIQIDVEYAAGEAANCTLLANQYVSGKYDLIMANATPALQAAVAATKTIPILGTSVTHYATALEIDDWTGHTGMNVSGTSDLAPLDQQASEMASLFDLKSGDNVALLYCASEANSVYQVTEVKKYLAEKGINGVMTSVSDSNDISVVCNDVANNNSIKAVYIPTDNTLAAATGAVNNALYGKKPVYAGEEGIAQGCGVATLSISYEALGNTTGEMAAEILLEGKDVSTMDIRFAPKFTKEYIKEYADLFNVSASSLTGYTEIAHKDAEE